MVEDAHRHPCLQILPPLGQVRAPHLVIAIVHTLDHARPLGDTDHPDPQMGAVITIGSEDEVVEQEARIAEHAEDHLRHVLDGLPRPDLPDAEGTRPSHLVAHHYHGLVALATVGIPPLSRDHLRAQGHPAVPLVRVCHPAGREMDRRQRRRTMLLWWIHELATVTVKLVTYVG